MFVSIIMAGYIGNVYASESCQSEVARIVSIQGTIELRRAHSTDWRQASLHTMICAGDMIRARTQSRAALRLANDSMLRLDQKTSITFPASPEEKASSLFNLFEGAIHIFTRTPKPFRIRTPFVNASVEGTEFFVGLQEDRTQVVVYEGKVIVSNELGSLLLSDQEAAITSKDQAPRKEVKIYPIDAVQWALYYPAILAEDPLQQPGYQSKASVLIERASHLLSVGQADEAQKLIRQSLQLEPDNSNALSLLSIIAVVQNDKEQANDFARQALAVDQKSVAAHLALSYVQQADFAVESALDSTQRAISLNSENALVWARLAELAMSVGQLDRGLEAAKQAVMLNPNVAKTHSVLGFAHLLQVDTHKAKLSFNEATRLDQADPLPRLGLGLALIREGKVAMGRTELEIATSLDPANSLIRSYLGKAYFEEKRYPLASTQFDLAKERDPQDPTPWFYDAIQKQTQNRPVEALRDIQKSIELNHNRAVYRSQFLLDRDEAARGSSLARIFENLGFEKRALMETTKSLNLDPANHSAHRFLSDAYANVPRHEVARVSELLQAQLLQPINVNPVQPHAAVADLNIITNTGPAVTGFNEFAPLMERNKPQLVASGIAGSNSTFGNEATLSAVYDRASVSFGQYHLQSDGFRANNDQKHNVYNAFLQYAVTPKLNIQTEFRRRNTTHGDLLLDFDTTKHTQNRRYLDQDSARIGARYSFSPKQDFLISVIYYDRRENQLIPVPAAMLDFNSHAKDQGYQIEGQYLYRDQYVNTVAGGGAYHIDASNLQRCVGVTCPPIPPAPPINFSRERENAYIYTNLNYFSNINTTVGVSYDAFKDIRDHTFSAFNPKFGLQWDLIDKLRLRLAWFETVKSALIANQTLEPTQVAGFTQMFDDLNGTRSRRMGVGLDYYLTQQLYGGIEISDRDLRVPMADGNLMFASAEKQQERLYRSYVYWTPHSHWAVSGEFQFEQYMRNALSNDYLFDKPYRINTLSAPLTLNYFHPTGFFGKFNTTFVQQNLKRLTPSTLSSDTDGFALFDTSLGYRLPNRWGILSLEGRNLSDEDFYYRSYNFQYNEMITSPRFIPTRTFFVRLTLNF